MNNIVTQRFIECIETLKKENKIKSGRQFALSLDYLPQGLSEIYKGRRDVTIELLRKAIEVYRISPQYLFLGKEPRLQSEEQQKEVRVLAIVTDQENRERIVHVPTPAQAGYADQYNNPVFVQSLPTYSLPDQTFQSGSYRSFDISGDSMLPTLHAGDRVICSYIEPAYWNQAIKDKQVYVIVTTGDVLVKRLVNKIRTKNCVMLLSDNEEYPEIVLPADELREIWKVRLKISPYLDPPEGRNVNQRIDQQTHLIEELNSRLNTLIEAGFGTTI